MRHVRRGGDAGMLVLVDLPAVSNINPTVIAAVYVHVLFHMPSEKAAIRHTPNASAKKMLAPRFG
jgi:hypothetical protein